MPDSTVTSPRAASRTYAITGSDGVSPEVSLTTAAVAPPSAAAASAGPPAVAAMPAAAPAETCRKVRRSTPAAGGTSPASAGSSCERRVTFAISVLLS